MDQKSESDELKELVGKELNVLRGDRGGQNKENLKLAYCGRFLVESSCAGYRVACLQ